ncbi:MAG: 2-amino-4-hydroxy-6-hydroxymethyldihydropteridine diphosphokinase [Bacilli bacterium]|uniref:2-amino-4-hydroxy-6- hydroxymethyldihydropteridine diphosphokinase n=1 Tax=Algoriella sp. TaxID=1872434 RepID=UPI002FC6D711
MIGFSNEISKTDPLLTLFEGEESAETNIRTMIIPINIPIVNRFPIIVENTLPKKFFISKILLLLPDMSTNTIILLLGTNLGNKFNNLESAKNHIKNEIGEITRESNQLENKAEGFTTENLFLNQKIEIISQLSPFEVLKKVKNIEIKMGRMYFQPLENEIYVDRLIDIDILYFNHIVIDSKRLKIPHPQNYSRSFVKSLCFY